MAWELNVQPNDLRLVEASAGSGKTYTLMNLVSELVTKGESADCILATTFTNKAAAELRQRIRLTLLASNRDNAVQQAAKAANGLIGTVNGVAGRILSEYALDAGLSPQLEVLPEDAAGLIFRRAVASVVEKHADEIRPVASRLGFSAEKKEVFNAPPDWPSVVQRLVDRARANGMGRDELVESCQTSVNVARNWFDGSVKLTLDEIVDEIRPHESELKRTDVGTGTAGYFESVAKFLRTPTWGGAATVAEAKLGKTDETPLRGIAEGLRSNLIHATGMRDDVVEMIRLIFNVAADGLDAYQQYKARYGLVDFTDQETGLLKLLQDGGFKAKLSERVHRVLVDEFQDTSPIQLALFAKLGEVAGGKMTWVGDPKQSIYGFRGADPALMAKAAARIGSEARAQLKFSWRSKKNLVDFSNVLFESAFQSVPGCAGTVRLGIPKKREEVAKGGELEAWMLGAGNVDARSEQLVDGIVQLHEESHVRYGDIAVLMRERDECKKIATALSVRGVPVSVGGGELFKAEEVVLALAAYRYAVDPRDTVALATLAAEVLEPEDWLKSLSEATKDTLDKWCGDCKLEALRKRVAALTPLELLDKVIVHFSIDTQSRKMGEGARRVANLEELRANCAQYMSAAALKGVPVTHAGFIADVAGKSAPEASVSGGDSVKVMTYHAAKGLEWPIVILSSLEAKEKRTPFNLEVVETESFDPANPLQGRRLRWVPCPIGSVSAFKQALLCENPVLSAEFDRVRLEELEERKRLMYVGVTRAKERLVFAPQVKKNRNSPPKVMASWLDELTPQSFFKDNWKFESGVDNWTVGDQQFVVTSRVFDGTAEHKPVAYARTPSKITPPGEFLRYKIPPSSKDVASCAVSVGEELPLTAALPVSEESITDVLGDCVHNYMAIALPGGDSPDLAAELIARWGQEETLAVSDLVSCGARLRAVIQQMWPGATVLTEVPMSYENAAGQLSEGYIDLLVKTPDGAYVIIDHKVVKNPDVSVHVQHYAGQQNLYRQAVSAVTGARVSVCLHLPCQGKLVEMKFN